MFYATSKSGARRQDQPELISRTLSHFGIDVKLAPIDASSVGNERSRAEARGSQTPTVWAALEEGPSRVRAIAELPPLWLGRSRLRYPVTPLLARLPTHNPHGSFWVSFGGIACVFSSRLAP